MSTLRLSFPFLLDTRSWRPYFGQFLLSFSFFDALFFPGLLVFLAGSNFRGQDFP